MTQDPSEKSDLGAKPFTPPELTSNQRQLIGDLLARWNVIQGRLKRAEQISQVAVLPAVNELRYAGRMLVGVLASVPSSTENNLPSIDDAIVISTQYLTNAEHDISDALIYFFQKKVDDLNSRYGAKAIGNEYSEYADICSMLQQARQLVIESRSNLSNRTDNYSSLVTLCDKISEHYFALVDSEVLFALEVEHYRAKITLLTQVCCALVVGFVASTAAAIFW